MTTRTKVLLGISVGAFLISPLGLAWGIAAPVGAICFGLSLISKILEKEMATYDDEQRARLAQAERFQPLKSEASLAHGTLSRAHSH